MCGFTGFLMTEAASGTDAVRRADDTLAAMTRTLALRGPDARAQHRCGRIGLGHCRLSIIDLSETGAQPMRLDDDLVISYNGECYNFQELRAELEGFGHRFRGHSDTEVVLHAYREWGLDGLKRLEGIFGFALWDARRERLVLMRDRLGVKPLFFGDGAGGLSFGSEIKAVLAAGGVDQTLDEQAFREFLWYGNTFEDRTFYRGVRSLLPGHWLIEERHGRRIEPWWRVEEWTGSSEPLRSFEEETERLRHEIDRAVARQMVADVPVALFLSGGIDSSAVAAAAARDGRSVRSYTAVFDYEAGVDESEKAAAVAKHLGLHHRELRIAGGDLPSVLETLATAHDEPFGDAANIPLYLMCRALDDDIKVVLQGDGGDELFAGYRRYALLRNRGWWRMVPRAARIALRRAGGLGQRVSRLADAVNQPDDALRMALLVTVETLDDPPEAMLEPDRRQALRDGTDPFLVYRNADARFRSHAPVERMLLTDLVAELPSTFLNKVDRATMASGIEARVPLLDDRMLRFALRMPAKWKVTRTKKKVMLRESLRGRIPDAILDAPKTGFGVPYEYWMRSSLYEYARERVLDPTFLRTFALRGDWLERQFVLHHSREKERGFLLWKMLQLALWHGTRGAA
jgi:asparagine synthase (glutamine-hydrolysing)